CAMPQPNFVPVSPSTSRTYHSSGIAGSPSKLCSMPLTFKRTIFVAPTIWAGAKAPAETCSARAARARDIVVETEAVGRRARILGDARKRAGAGDAAPG